MKFRLSIVDFRLGLVAVAALISFSSCARVYNAPDPTRVAVATKRVKQDISVSKKSAQEAKKLVEKAQRQVTEMAIARAGIMQRIKELLLIAPPELKPPLMEIENYVIDLDKGSGDLSDVLVSTWKKQDETEKAIGQTEVDEQSLEREQKVYYDKSVEQAKKMTKMSADLAWYRLHWWLGTFIAIGGVILCVVLAFVKWGAKWTAKLGIAAAKTGI